MLIEYSHLSFHMTTSHTQLNIICLETEAFDLLVEEVVGRLSDKQRIKEKWISDIDAMQLMQIKSKSTLQKLRDEGKIRFSQPMKKIILYDRESIEDYIEQHAKETF